MPDPAPDEPKQPHPPTLSDAIAGVVGAISDAFHAEQGHAPPAASTASPAIEPAPIVVNIDTPPAPPHNTFRGTVPTKPSTGYAPTSFAITLTGKEAEKLRDIGEGFRAAGIAVQDPGRVIGLLLDQLHED